MHEPLKLGVAGLGTVGTGLLQLLTTHGRRLSQSLGRELQVVGVSARSRSKDRGVSLAGMRWYDDPVALAADPGIDVFVELIGGDEGPARRAVEAALSAGRLSPGAFPSSRRFASRWQETRSAGSTAS
jgi:homoserine dehydrogenase